MGVPLEPQKGLRSRLNESPYEKAGKSLLTDVDKNIIPAPQ